MTAATAHAAQLCIDALSTATPASRSPLHTVISMASTLESSRQAWVIHGQSHSRRVGNWPAWFARNAVEKPLLYLHNAHSCAVGAGGGAELVLDRDIGAQGIGG